MIIKPLRADLEKYLTSRSLTTKFSKQCRLLILNPHHPSLNLERLEPKSLKLYSIRIDRQYRAILIFTSPSEIEIIDINNHYQ